MQDEKARGLGPRLAHKKPVRRQRYCLPRPVFDLVGDRKEEIFVDRDGARKMEPVAIVPHEFDRLVGAQRCRPALPKRVGGRDLKVRIAARLPAELGVIAVEPRFAFQENDLLPVFAQFVVIIG